MKVAITARDDAKQTATVMVMGAKLGFFANPTQAEPAPISGTMGYSAQFVLDKEAEGANELIAMLRQFRKAQEHPDEPVRWCVTDCDVAQRDGKNLNPETGKVWDNVKGKWEIAAYRQAEGQSKGQIFLKRSLKAGQQVPAGWTQKGNSIVKFLTSQNEISGNDIVNIEFGIYHPKKSAGVFAGWNWIQLVSHTGKGGGQQRDSFDDLPDSEDFDDDFSDFEAAPAPAPAQQQPTANNRQQPPDDYSDDVPY